MPALFIAPIIAGVQAILAKYMPGLLAGSGFVPFTGYAKTFVGQTVNPPECWVMPVRTPIDDEGNTYKETHLVTIKFSITGSEPDDLDDAAMAYCAAIHNAIEAAQPADWGAVIPLHAHVFEHDYGPVYQRDGVTAKFPEVHLEVEVQEVID